MYSTKVTSQHDPDPGLCRTCQHGRRIVSDRGSVFFQCKLAFTDSSFAKYPRLPVFACSGHTPVVPTAERAE